MFEEFYRRTNSTTAMVVIPAIIAVLLCECGAVDRQAPEFQELKLWGFWWPGRLTVDAGYFSVKLEGWLSVQGLGALILIF